MSTKKAEENLTAARVELADAEAHEVEAGRAERDAVNEAAGLKAVDASTKAKLRTNRARNAVATAEKELERVTSDTRHAELTDCLRDAEPEPVIESISSDARKRLELRVAASRAVEAIDAHDQTANAKIEAQRKAHARAAELARMLGTLGPAGLPIDSKAYAAMALLERELAAGSDMQAMQAVEQLFEVASMGGMPPGDAFPIADRIAAVRAGRFVESLRERHAKGAARSNENAAREREGLARIASLKAETLATAKVALERHERKEREYTAGMNRIMGAV